MEKIVYKLVQRPQNDTYLSLRGSEETDIGYKIGKKFSSKIFGNPLIAFDTLKNAFRFRGEQFPFNPILKCRAKLHKNNDFSGWFEDYGYGVPKGSILCDWVIPVEEVVSAS